MSADTPADVKTPSSSTNKTLGCTRISGWLRDSNCACRQWVVARRPDSTSAAARANEPVQIDTSLWVRGRSWWIVAIRSAGTARLTSTSAPATMTVSGSGTSSAAPSTGISIPTDQSPPMSGPASQGRDIADPVAGTEQVRIGQHLGRPRHIEHLHTVEHDEHNPPAIRHSLCLSR
jgi:hypothetical protein